MSEQTNTKRDAQIAAIVERLNSAPITADQTARMLAASERDELIQSSDDYLIHA